jgi:Family of unknown function (DUF6311)
LLKSILAFFMGAALYVAYSGTGHLDPHALGWMSDGDRFAHLMGWLFFHKEAWQWPIGHFSSEFFPDGSSVAYTDAIPWFAVLMKAIAPFQGQPVQFFGIYLVLCHGLQTFFGWRIFQRLGLNRWQSILGVLLLFFTPIILQRSVEHIALCSHWIILWAIEIYLAERDGQPRQVQNGVLLFLSAATHPYLAVMALTILSTSRLSLTWTLKRSLSRRLFELASFVGLTAITFWLFGYFQKGGAATEGFDLFSADLLTFINPMKNSTLISQIRMSPSQSEGFAYLGLGLIFLGVLAFFRRKNDLKLKPLWIAVSLMAFYSLSSHLSIAGHTFAQISFLYAPFGAITSAFRSCGRFVWPLYYLIVIMIIYKVSREKKSLILLSIALLIQLIDLGPAYVHAREKSEGLPEKERVTEAIWHGVGQRFHKISFTSFDQSFVCNPGWGPPNDFVKLAVMALQEGLVMDHGFAAHARVDRLKAVCEAEVSEIQRGIWDPRTIYVFNESTYGMVSQLLLPINPSLLCGVVDGVRLCVEKPDPKSDSPRTSLENFLQKS